MSKGAGVGLALIIILLGIGALGGYVLLPKLFGTLGVPGTHQFIVDNMEIKQPNIAFTLSPRCVDSGSKELGKDELPPLAVFQTGTEYPQSTWIWTRWGDTEAAMTIWGPGDDGITYEVEIARLGGYPLEIYYEDDLIKSMTWASDYYSIMPGYCWFSVKLE